MIGFCMNADVRSLSKLRLEMKVMGFHPILGDVRADGRGKCHTGLIQSYG